MALIKCPECGRENVSDTAESCPSCGFGIHEYFEKLEEEKSKVLKEKQRKIKKENQKVKKEEVQRNINSNYENERAKIIQKINSLKEDDLLDFIGIHDIGRKDMIVGLLGVCILTPLGFLTGFKPWILDGIFAAIFIFGWFAYGENDTVKEISAGYLLCKLPMENYRMETYKWAKKNLEDYKKKKIEQVNYYYDNIEESKRKEEEELKERQALTRIRVSAEANKPKCPNCGSTNISPISTMSRATSVALVGIASSKIGKQYECKNCKYKW
jgi:hypothetical protein